MQWRMTARSALPEPTMTGVDGAPSGGTSPENRRTYGMVRSSSARSCPAKGPASRPCCRNRRGRDLSIGRRRENGLTQPADHKGMVIGDEHAKSLSSLIVSFRRSPTALRNEDRSSAVAVASALSAVTLFTLHLPIRTASVQAVSILRSSRSLRQSPRSRNVREADGMCTRSCRNPRRLRNAGQFAADKDNILFMKREIQQTRFALCRQQHQPPLMGGAPGGEACPRIMALRWSGLDIAIAARRNRLSLIRKPAGSMITASTPRHAQVRIMAPVFWAMWARTKRAEGARPPWSYSAQKQKVGGRKRQSENAGSWKKKREVGAMDNQFDRCEKPGRTN